MKFILINIFEAIASIRTNRLRAGLTMLIISFGIMAIVGVMTTIESIKFWMTNNFSTLGANTFQILNRESTLRIGQGRSKTKRFPDITYSEAKAFRERVQNNYTVCLTTVGSWQGKVKYQNKTTNGNLRVYGTDENYLLTQGYSIVEGRAIAAEDVHTNRDVIVIGQEIKQMLFPRESPIGKKVFLDKKQYTVIGLLNEKGTSFGSPGDKVVLLPVGTCMQSYPHTNRDFTINVYVQDPSKLLPAVEYAAGIFRLVRQLRPADNNNFAVTWSDTFVSNLMDNLSILTVSAIAISIITLFGASIGLMNIMLVSVTERTKEIGLRKALGATQGSIKLQFLIEAITICQFGGILGILFGIGIGNLIGVLLGTDFFVPWNWVGIAVGICFFVGTLSGYYPAQKAAKLDPIEALRHDG